MNGQMTISDYLETMQDMTSDRNGKREVAPSWMNRERCEHCQSWTFAPDQPPFGWGVVGWCKKNLQKTQKASYCQNFERS